MPWDPRFRCGRDDSSPSASSSAATAGGFSSSLVCADCAAYYACHCDEQQQLCGCCGETTTMSSSSWDNKLSYKPCCPAAYRYRQTEQAALHTFVDAATFAASPPPLPHRCNGGGGGGGAILTSIDDPLTRAVLAFKRALASAPAAYATLSPRAKAALLDCFIRL